MRKSELCFKIFKKKKTQRLINTLLKISDENKLKIILALIKEKELCVCDLSITLGLSIASTSHHLRALYKRDVLDFYKDGENGILLYQRYRNEIIINKMYDLNIKKRSH